MGINARFVADFSSFQEAVSKAELKLVDFSKGAGKVETALNKMVDSFSGRKVISEAALMEKAIGGVEGLSKLTESELRRVGNTASDAVEKMKRIGVEVPPGLQKIYDATKPIPPVIQKITDTAAPIPSLFSKITSTLGPLGTALVGAFTVRAITGAITNIAAVGSGLADLAAKSGIGTSALQEFKYAGDQVGVSLDTVIGAMGQFANRLGSGDKSALGALKALGISFNDIRSMRPEDQFQLLASKLNDVTDQTAFVKVGMDLMGRGFLEVAPLIRADLDLLIDRARRLGVVISEETITNLDALDDTLAGLKAVGTAVMADFLTPFVPLITKTGTALMGFGNIVSDLQGAFERFLSVGAGWGKWFADTQIAVLSFYNVGGLADGQIKRLRESSERYGAIAKDLATTQTKVATETAKVSTAMKPLMVDYDKLGEKTKKAGDEKQKLTARVRELEAGLYLVPPALASIGRSYDETKLGPLAASIRQVEQDARQVAFSGLRGITNELQALGEQSKVTMGDLDWMKTFVGPIESAANAARRLRDPLDNVLDVLKNIDTDFANMANVAIRAFQKIDAAWKNTGMTRGEKFTAIAGIGLSAGASMAGNNATGAALKGAATGFAATAAAYAAMGSTIGPWGTAIGATAGAVISLVKWFKANSAHKAVNDLRDAFIEAAGGLDQLNQRAFGAGATLTNLLDAKNPRDYKAAIDELNGALQFQDDAMAMLNTAIEKYGFSIDQLGPTLSKQKLNEQAAQLVTDFRLLERAGIDVNNISIQMSSSINEYLKNAMRTGTAVPEAMRDILNQLATMGLLTDENGNLISDLEDAGVTFAQTLDDQFKTLIGTIEKLTDAIARGLGLALENVPDANVDVNVTRRYRDEEDGGDTSGAVPMARGGRGRVTKPTLFLAGESGAEDFAFSGGGRRFGRTSAAAVAPAPVIVNIYGGKFNTPSDRLRAANEISQALMDEQRLERRLNVA